MNGHGGHRRGAGRKRGSLSTKTREIAEQATASGETPLEYMLRVMRSSTNAERRDRMAAAAAPYVHPRLQATTLGGDVAVGAYFISDKPKTPEEWERDHCDPQEAEDE